MGASDAKELIKVKILPDVDQYFQIRASMSDAAWACRSRIYNT